MDPKETRVVSAIHRLIIVLSILGFFSAPAKCAEVVMVGVLAHRGEDIARARWAKTIQYINNELKDHTFELLPLSLEGVNASLENNGLDFLITNPGHYHTISDIFRLSQIASLKSDRKGKPVTGNRYGAVIFVRSDRTDIRTLGDLKNRTFAAVAPDAFGGFLAAVQTFQHNGIDPYSELKAIKYMGFPQDAIVEAVMRGDEDAGTVRTGIIESMISSGRIAADDVRILNLRSINGFELLLSTQLFPEWTFAASANTSAALKKSVAQALFMIDEKSAPAVAGRYGGWNTPMFDGNVRRLISGKLQMEDNARLAWNIALLIAGIAVGVTVAIGVYFLGGRSIAAKLTGRNELPAKAEFLRLTPRENQVLSHVVSGKTNKEIARELDISPKTVEFHRKHLMKKMNAESIADLVRIAVERENAGIRTET